MRKRRIFAAAAALPLAIAGTGVAYADNIQDSIADNGAPVNLVAGSGVSKSASIKVVANNSDGNTTDPQCNWDAGEAPLVLDVVTPAGVTANPDPVSITNCGEDVPVSFTASANAVSGTVTVAIVSVPAGGGGYNNQVAIPITVSQPTPTDATAPVITPSVNGTLGDNGWYTSNVALSWTVVDPESTITSQTGCANQTISTDQLATNYTCSATSAGGTSSRTVSIKRDATAPVISAADVNALAWRNSSLGQAFTATDATSGLANAADANFTLTASDQSANTSTPTTATRTVKDAAGNSSTRSLSAFIDYDAPVISGTDIADPVWRNTSLTGSFTASDSLSGLANATDSNFDLTASAESTDSSTPTLVSKTVTDKAGNSSSRSVSAFIDQTDPSISGDDVEDETWRKTPLTIHFTAEDLLSGLFNSADSNFDLTASDESEDAETPTVVRKTVTDRAGNESSRSVSAFIDLSAPVISGSDVEDSNWRQEAFSRTFTASDRLSGLADAADAEFTLTTDGESSDAATPVTASKTVYDNVGHSTTRTISAMVDTTKPWIIGPDRIETTWRNTSLSVDFTAGDDLSGLADGEADAFTLTASDESASASSPTVVTHTATDKAGNQRTRTVSALIDKTAPVVSPGSVDNRQWRNTPLSQTFTASDGRSGLADDADASFELMASADSMDALHPTLVRHTVYDLAGNATERTVSALIDTAKPTDISFVGDPAATVYYGDSVTAPTCTASDALSGLVSCIVTGGGTSPGAHKFTATATDRAGNTATKDFNYTVLAWNLKGFYSPVDMGGVFNTVKAGSTVPMKFEVFAGTRELTTLDSIKSFTVNLASCSSGAATDDIETTTSGATILRYDTTGGQFIQNWQTPKKAGSCYLVTVTTQDNSSISAKFQLK